MRTQLGPQPLPDLVRPAFKMLDPHVTFQEALTTTDIDETSDEYLAFSDIYAIQLPLDKLELQRECRLRKQEYSLTDPRISEMVNHALSENKWRDEDQAGKGDGSIVHANDGDADRASLNTQGALCGSRSI